MSNFLQIARRSQRRNRVCRLLTYIPSQITKSRKLERLFGGEKCTLQKKWRKDLESPNSAETLFGVPSIPHMEEIHQKDNCNKDLLNLWSVVRKVRGWLLDYCGNIQFKNPPRSRGSCNWIPPKCWGRCIDSRASRVIAMGRVIGLHICEIGQAFSMFQYHHGINRVAINHT